MRFVEFVDLMSLRLKVEKEGGKEDFPLKKYIGLDKIKPLRMRTFVRGVRNIMRKMSWDLSYLIHLI